MAMSLVVGPDARGRRVAIVEGRVVAEAPAGAAHLPCPDGIIAPGAVCAWIVCIAACISCICLSSFAMRDFSSSSESFSDWI